MLFTDLLVSESLPRGFVFFVCAGFVCFVSVLYPVVCIAKKNSALTKQVVDNPQPFLTNTTFLYCDR